MTAGKATAHSNSAEKKERDTHRRGGKKDGKPGKTKTQGEAEVSGQQESSSDDRVHKLIQQRTPEHVRGPWYVSRVTYASRSDDR